VFVRRWVAALGALAILLGSTLAAPSTTAPRVAQAANGLIAGVIVDSTNPRSMEMASDAGFTHAKMIIFWPRLEPSKGRFSWSDTHENDLDNVIKAARAEDMTLIVRVDGVPDWAGGSPAKVDPDHVQRFYEAMAAKGKGVIAGYEILNEPNLPFEWGGPPSPSGYAAFLKAAYKGVKKADPDAIVIGGGVSPNTGGFGGTMEDFDFLRGIYAAGARGHMDALSVHNYGGNFEPEQDPGSCGICFRRAELYRQIMVEAGDSATKVWSTEFGWLMDPGRDMGQYDWMKVSAEKQADYLVRSFRYAAKNWSWMGGMLISNLDASTSGYHTDPQNGLPWFAILNKDHSPRPAYKALKSMIEKDPETFRRPGETVARAASPTPTPTPASTPQTAPPPPPPVQNPPQQSALQEIIDNATTAPATTAPPIQQMTSTQVRVVGTDGEGLSLRASPSTTATRLKAVPEGAQLDVIGPDVEVEGRVWRNVRDASGTSGWAIGLYLAP
jgi:hypothetical protein